MVAMKPQSCSRPHCPAGPYAHPTTDYTTEVYDDGRRFHSCNAGNVRYGITPDNGATWLTRDGIESGYSFTPNRNLAYSYRTVDDATKTADAIRDLAPHALVRPLDFAPRTIGEHPITHGILTVGKLRALTDGLDAETQIVVDDGEWFRNVNRVAIPDAETPDNPWSCVTLFRGAEFGARQL